MGLGQLSESQLNFRSFDGTELFYRAWLPEAPAERALILFHRGHEHSGRFAKLVEELQVEGTAYFAWDSRGHGRSPGERGYANHLMDLVRDVDAFVRHVGTTYSIRVEDISVLAHSVAAVVVGLWVHDFAPRIRSLILATPALQVKLYVPLALPALRLQLWWSRKRGAAAPYVKSYVSGKLLTHDAEQAKEYDSDPLISKQIAVNILLNLSDSANRLVADAGAIRVPVLLLVARTDWVVKNKPAKVFYERLSSDFKRVAVFRGFYHSIFHERNRSLVTETCRTFLADAQHHSLPQTTLLTADSDGYTADEYQWVRAGSPPISLKRVGFSLMKLLMRTAGRLSAGVRIGWEHGFDSGSSLDYVYRNTETGTTAVGRLLDRAYLDSPGWTGIRKRKQNLETLLDRAIDRCVQSGFSQPLRIMDVAGGPGRYLLETAKRRSDVALDLVIRDFNVAGLNEGRALAQSLGLSAVLHQQADAFDEAELSSIEPKRDIVVVSGLYELFPDNGRVLSSLRGISHALRPGGILIYTNQPWHPQLEFIAEVLTNREGAPWVMRRRTQAEMDALVESQGFRKQEMLIDNEGIFTVSFAEKAE
ncbi:MAG: bifunctional alpha/beta hydrolase/class I SAM-dependent methyltransferase [Bdellovibrionota bacterium]